jgi:NAD(P)H-dependent flavin oxidoreductase YrpB (nitropropane dioxygenase family)
MRRGFRSAIRAGERQEYPAVAGQISGLIHDIRPVAEIIETMLADAAALAERLDGMARGRLAASQSVEETG